MTIKGGRSRLSADALASVAAPRAKPIQKSGVRDGVVDAQALIDNTHASITDADGLYIPLTGLTDEDGNQIGIPTNPARMSDPNAQFVLEDIASILRRIEYHLGLITDTTAPDDL